MGVVKQIKKFLEDEIAKYDAENGTNYLQEAKEIPLEELKEDYTIEEISRKLSQLSEDKKEKP